MVAISNYFATLGVKVDNKSLKDVDNFLAKIEKKLSSGTGKKGMSIVPKVDVAAFEKHLRQVLRGIGGKNSSALRVKVQVSEQGMRKSIDTMLSKKNFNIPVTATLSKASLTALRQQLQSALVGVPVHVRMSGAQGGRKTPTGAVYSWSPNASGGGRVNSRAPTTPHLAEWLGGKPDRSSLSAANRRYSDSMMKQGFFGPDGAPNTLTGLMGESVLGGLGRVGSSTMVGRGLGAFGNMIGGARGGAIGLITGSVIPAVTGVFKGIWGGLATVVTAPFKMIGGAANAVTSGFYRVALAIAPLVGGFMLLNRTVQRGTQREVALNTVSKSLGSTGAAESKWLMDMADRDGMRYNTLIDPYTSFIASASPAMGLNMAKSVFEGFTQFGATRGASDVSMGLAMKAVSQMAGKGKIQAEELRGQLGDAPGFGEMQGIFAQAYQRSIGREGANAKQGQKAIEELNDAMEKGNVLSAKVLPFVAEIAKEMAAGGLQQARFTSSAEQARFDNQIARGWGNFRTGGGEEGLAYFWRMMQQMGTWWESNGAKLGDYFRILMVDLNTLRVGIMEFAQFAITGESNDFTKYISDFGINLYEFRDNIVRIINETFKIFGGGEGGDLKSRIQNFSTRLNDILIAVGDMLANIAIFMNAARQLNQRSWTDSFAMFNPFSDVSKQLRTGQTALVNAAGNALGATGSAGGALTDMLGVSSSGASDYRLYGNNRGGFGGAGQSPITLPPTSLPQMYTPGMQANMGQTISGKVDVNVKVEGNPDLASQLNTPQAQSIIRKATQEGITGMLTGSMPNAPKN